MDQSTAHDDRDQATAGNGHARPGHRAPTAPARRRGGAHTICYGPFARFADWWHGFWDGWKEIPPPPQPGAPWQPVTTGHREALIRMAQDAFEHERLVFEDGRTGVLARIADAAARHTAACAAQRRAEKQLAAVSRPLTEQELAEQRFGEQRRPGTVARRRRREEQRRRSAAVRREVEAAARIVSEQQARLATATAEAGQHMTAAQTRVRRIHEYVHRRLAAYRRRLVRSHPQGAWVNDAMGIAQPGLPGWAFPPRQPPPPAVRAARARSGRNDQEDPERAGKAPARAEPQGEIIALGRVTIFGSERPPAHILLDVPGAAPRHFMLQREGDGFRLRDLAHVQGPYINGQPVSSAHLAPGEHFDFADQRYWILGDGTGLRRIPLGKCDLIVAGLNATTGDKVRLFKMSFVQREKTLLAVLGPSGAGKTSLFYALTRELKTESGDVYFQGLHFRTDGAQIRDEIGFVPQDSELFDTLTVRRSLGYAHRLRTGSGPARRAARIAAVCADLGIGNQIDQLVGTLSGGQRKRASIAMEMLTAPRLLMLDEPTSGLDAGMDREVMSILRDYARDGKTVVVITHSTDHLHLAQQVLIVVENGRPVYSGPPREERRALGVDSYADLMQKLTRQPGPAAAAYASGPWAEEAEREARRAHAEAELARAHEPGPTLVRRRGPVRAFGRQLPVLLERQVALVVTRGLTTNRSNRSTFQWIRGIAVAVMPFLSAAAGAALAALVSGGGGLGAAPGGRGSDAGPGALSILTILCMLSGQALSYSDLVSEQRIIRREHRTGTVTLAVTLSKWLIFSVIAALEAALITLVFVSIRPGPVHGLFFGPTVGLMVDLAGMTIAAMSLGLLISAVARKLEEAVTYVTVISIAQIALNGVISNLSGGGIGGLHVIAWLLPTRWGLAAAASSADLRGIDPLFAFHDALWRHSLLQWAQDLIALWLLTMVYFGAASLWLNRRLSKPG